MTQQLRQAIITFDPERIRQINVQAEGGVIAWALKCALLGEDYARERGIESIDLIDPDAAIYVRPARLDRPS